MNYMELNAADSCDYDSNNDGTADSNWATAWQSSHTEGVDWYDCGAQHSQPLNANQKAYAAWWLWARLAGWSGPGSAVLSISDASVGEGNANTTPAVFTVTLSAPVAQTVTVQYQTSDGTATAGDSDYTTTSGTLTFAASEVSKTISVPVLGDTRYELNETFYLTLSDATNASIGAAQGTGTIVEDDVPTETLSIDDVSVTEGNAGTVSAAFTVTLSAAST